MARSTDRAAALPASLFRVLDQTPAMSTAQFLTCKHKMGLSAAEMGRHLSLKGLSRDLSRAIRRFETGKTTIDTNMAEKVHALVVAHESTGRAVFSKGELRRR